MIDCCDAMLDQWSCDALKLILSHPVSAKTFLLGDWKGRRYHANLDYFTHLFSKHTPSYASQNAPPRNDPDNEAKLVSYW